MYPFARWRISEKETEVARGARERYRRKLYKDARQVASAQRKRYKIGPYAEIGVDLCALNTARKVLLVLGSPRIDRAKIVHPWVAENTNTIEVFCLPSPFTLRPITLSIGAMDFQASIRLSWPVQDAIARSLPWTCLRARSRRPPQPYPDYRRN